MTRSSYRKCWQLCRMGVGSSCLAKGTCGESATRRRSASANRSASKSTTRSANRKRARATNGPESRSIQSRRSATAIRLPTNTTRRARSALSAQNASFFRGVAAIKRYSKGRQVHFPPSVMRNVQIADKVGNRLTESVLKGEIPSRNDMKKLRKWIRAAESNSSSSSNNA